jgi:mono/diheme cytochrome c family protein
MVTQEPGVLLTMALILLSPIRGQEAPAGRDLGWNAPISSEGLRNPYAGIENHRLAGKKLFQRYCSSCHGKNAGGTKGVPPLTSERVREASEGRLFWYIRNGNRRAGMPGWSRLPDEQLWQLVSFLQMPGPE